jgi:hypothetical protein
MVAVCCTPTAIAPSTSPVLPPTLSPRSCSRQCAGPHGVQRHSGREDRPGRRTFRSGCDRTVGVDPERCREGALLALTGAIVVLGAQQGEQQRPDRFFLESPTHWPAERD